MANNIRNIRSIAVLAGRIDTLTRERDAAIALLDRVDALLDFGCAVIPGNSLQVGPFSAGPTTEVNAMFAEALALVRAADTDEPWIGETGTGERIGPTPDHGGEGRTMGNGSEGLAWQHGPARGNDPLADGLVECGDRFLIAVCCINRNGGKPWWYMNVIVASETGWDDASGESWSDWSWLSVEWFIRLDKGNLPDILENNGHDGAHAACDHGGEG